MQDTDRYPISADSRLVGKPRQRGDARARILAGIEAMERFVGVPRACGIEEQIVQQRLGTPSFLVAQGGAQGLAGDVESAAFVAENVAPSGGARCASLGVAAEREGAGAGDGDDARIARSGAGKGDES